MLIQLDDEFPNVLKDNILYFFAGYIIKNLLPDLQCVNCKTELLLNFQDPKGFNTSSFPLFTRLTCFKQNGDLIYPSSPVLRIVKATEIPSSRRLIKHRIGINTHKNLNLKLQSSVFQHVGPQTIYITAAHFFEHRIGIESDHLSSLLKDNSGEVCRYVT